MKNYGFFSRVEIFCFINIQYFLTKYVFIVIFQDSDLRSALLLEQAAHCYINMETPKVRKYSFHMILAGHRYSKSGQVVFTV